MYAQRPACPSAIPDVVFGLRDKGSSAVVPPLARHWPRMAAMADGVISLDSDDEAPLLPPGPPPVRGAAGLPAASVLQDAFRRGAAPAGYTRPVVPAPTGSASASVGRAGAARGRRGSKGGRGSSTAQAEETSTGVQHTAVLEPLRLDAAKGLACIRGLMALPWGNSPGAPTVGFVLQAIEACRVVETNRQGVSFQWALWSESATAVALGEKHRRFSGWRGGADDLATGATRRRNETRKR